MSSELKIRKAKLKDSTAIAEIQRLAFDEIIQHYFGTSPSNRRKIKSFTDDLYRLVTKSMRDEIFVAEIDNKIVGNIMVPYDIRRFKGNAARSRIFWLIMARSLLTMAAMSRDSKAVLMSDRRFIRELYSTDVGRQVHSRVFNIAVHPDFQGRGIGKTLLKKGLQYLFNEKGANAVALNVLKENESALKLYLNFGFKEVKQLDNSFGEWIVMRLDREIWLQHRRG